MEKTTILDDINELRRFAAEAGAARHTIDNLEAAEFAFEASLLSSVARVFAPSKRSETAKTVAPEVARAELAKLPVPRHLWDDVLEPLLAMAEGAAERRAELALEQIRRLVRDARLVADDSVDPNDADNWQPTVGVAINAVRALMTLSQSYDMPDHASWMRVVEDCLRNRRAVYVLRAELEQRGWAKLIGGSRTEVEVLHEWARECPQNFTQGQTPEIAAVLEAVESLFSRVESHIPSLPPMPSPFSKELEKYRAIGPLPSILSWMEMIERRVALLVEHARTAPAVDDETPKPGPAVETGDAVEALRRLVEVIEQGGGPTKLSRGVDLGQASWMVKLAFAIDSAKAVLERGEVDIAVRAWDEHSEAICDALGPYYSDDGAGYDYDGMVLAIRALRAHSQALQELLSIHESDWPHDVAMKAATCVTLLSKSCNRWYCANGLLVAAGGSCPSCGPSRGPAAVAQQIPDPAQGA